MGDISHFFILPFFHFFLQDLWFMVASVCAGRLEEFPSWAHGRGGIHAAGQAVPYSDHVKSSASHLGLIRKHSTSMPGTEGMSTGVLAGVHT